MNRRLFHILTCAASLAFLLAFRVGDLRAGGTPLLKVGFAERDITPDIGMEQPGGYGKAFHRTLHDPCKVRAAVFDDGKQRVALVGIDALAVRRPLVEAVPQGDPRADAASRPRRSSSAPRIRIRPGRPCMVLPGEYDHASPLVKSLAYEKSSCADAELPGAGREADRRGGLPGRPGPGGGPLRRRQGDRGQGGLQPPLPHEERPDLHPSRPAQSRHRRAGRPDRSRGGRDRRLEPGRASASAAWSTTPATPPATRAASRPTGSTTWSRRSAARWATDCVVVFLQGACGDVTQVDNLNPYVESRRARSGARLVGGRVGAEAVKVLLSMARGPLAPVDARCKMLDDQAPRAQPRAGEEVPGTGAAAGPRRSATPSGRSPRRSCCWTPSWPRSRRPRWRCRRSRSGRPCSSPIRPSSSASWAWTSRPRARFQFTFPVELANDCVGYVPTEEALGPHGGGYETRLTAYSNLEPAPARRWSRPAWSWPGR